MHSLNKAVVELEGRLRAALERSEEANARLLELYQTEQTRRDRFESQLDEERQAAQERARSLSGTLVEFEGHLQDSGAALERSEAENARLLKLCQSEQTQRERLEEQIDEEQRAAQEREHSLNMALVELEGRLRESGAALERSDEESARLSELYEREQTQRERLDGQIDDERQAAQEREGSLNRILTELDSRIRDGGAALERSEEESAQLQRLYQREQTQRERLEGQLGDERQRAQERERSQNQTLVELEGRLQAARNDVAAQAFQEIENVDGQSSHNA